MRQRETGWWLGRPASALRDHVSAYIGYRTEQPQGIHRGLPTGAMTFIVSLGSDIRVLRHVDPRQPPSEHGCVIGGLQTVPALIARGGLEEGVAIELTPLGSRALLGRPAADLAGLSVDGADVLGPPATQLRERLAAARSWAARFAVVDAVLGGLVDHEAVAASTARAGWQLLAASGGRAPVGAVAAAIGCSRRHLSASFQTEFGLTPKAAGRVLRFERAVALLRGDSPPGLAGVAVACGYYDQAHLNREFRMFAGCTPTAWRREEFPSVQDTEGG